MYRYVYIGYKHGIPHVYYCSVYNDVKKGVVPVGYLSLSCSFAIYRMYNVYIVHTHRVDITYYVTCIYVFMFLCIDQNIYIYIYIFIYIYKYIYIHIYINMYVYICVCMCMRMYLLYTHTHA